jgi:hypothetical protein
MEFSYFSLNRWLILVSFCVISIFIVYKQATDANSISLQEHVARHERMLASESEFYNPWQYRIFSAYVTEGFYQIVHAVVPRIDRATAFLIFRFAQNLFIFWIAYLYFNALAIRNPFLKLGGILLLAYSMAHSVFQSDLSFNTYFDVLFYLLGAYLIIKEKYNWVIALMIVAALNRETSLLIPAMLVIPFIQWKKLSMPRQILWMGVLSTTVFLIVFVVVRWHYGYRPAQGIHGMKSFTDYLKFNLSFFRMYPELIGTLTFIPIFVLLYIKRLPKILQQWFWIVCPAWFLIHMAYSTAIETRLFLVPHALIFIPAFLWLIENWYKTEPTAQVQ